MKKYFAEKSHTLRWFSNFKCSQENHLRFTCSIGMHFCLIRSQKRLIKNRMLPANMSPSAQLATTNQTGQAQAKWSMKSTADVESASEGKANHRCHRLEKNNL
jgi:hypothetical protein